MKYLNSFIIACCLMLCCSGVALAQEGGLTFTWDANSESDLAGYKIYIDTVSKIDTALPEAYKKDDSTVVRYDRVVDVGNVTRFTVTGLDVGTVYFAALTAYDTWGNESTWGVDINGVVTEPSGPAKDIINPKHPVGFAEATTNVNNSNPITPIP